MTHPIVIENLCDMVDACRARIDDVVEDNTDDLSGSNLALLQQASVDQDADNRLWSFNELALFANEAVREVAIRTKCIRENTSALAVHSIAAADVGNPWIALDSRVLQIKRARWEGKPIGLAWRHQLDEGQTDWESEQSDGEKYLVFDSGAREFRLYPHPSVDGTLTLDVVREPISKMVEPNDVPEVPQKYLFGAINWMCHLAYQKMDSETANPQLADRFETVFERQFGGRLSEVLLFQDTYATPRNRARIHWF